MVVLTGKKNEPAVDFGREPLARPEALSAVCVSKSDRLQARMSRLKSGPEGQRAKVRSEALVCDPVS